MRFILPAALFALINCTQADLATELQASFCQDDFNRPDSGSLGDQWEFVGPGVLPSGHVITGQKAKILLPVATYGFTACKYKVNQKKTLYSVRLVPLTAVNQQLALIARAQAKQTLSDAYYCSFDALIGRLVIYKGVIAERIDLAVSGPGTLTVGSEYALTFSLSGGELECRIAGPMNASITATDSTFTSGYTGIFMYAGMSVQEFTFDDFKTEVYP